MGGGAYQRPAALLQGVLQATDWALKPAADQAAAAEKPSGRKGKGSGKSALRRAGDGVRAALPAVNAESNAASATTDEAAGTPPPPHSRQQAARQPDAAGRRYPRKVAPSAKQHEADAGANFLAAMRAHFQEVSVGMCLVSAWCLNVSRALINGKDKVALLKGQLGGH